MSAPDATAPSTTATTIRPVPTDAEAAAIVAAVEASWPRAVVVEPTASHTGSPWRFSGRWWSVPLPVRRNRPWR